MLFENQMQRYGAIAKSLPFTLGKIFFVVNSSDAWAGDIIEALKADSDGQVRVFTSLSSAYDATVSGRNDVIVLDSNTAHSLTSMLTVSKNRVHIVSVEWLAGARRTQDQRCRVTMAATSGTSNVALMKVTGNGCSLRGIKLAQSSTVAQALTCLQDESPNGLLVENCSIHSLAAAQLTATGGSALRLAGDGSEYRNCQIGADTVTNTVANQVINIANANGAYAKRARFEKCEIYTATSATTHVFVRVQADADIDRYVTFDTCNFHNFYTTGNGALMAVAFATPANLVSGSIHIVRPAIFGATDLATAAVGNASILVIGGGSPTAGSDGIAVQPTA